MARIRTIKPEFWTDEKIVRLPFEARLLFIGLWNFADDQGYMQYAPDRIRMQILPGDDIDDIESLLSLLEAAELIEVLCDEWYDIEVLRIVNFTTHQKVSNPAVSKLAQQSEKYKKRTVPAAVRRQVALKYGCEPGCEKTATCYACKAAGNIKWWLTGKNVASGWVSFSGLELSHFTPEHQSGEPTTENIVLCCRFCNRSMGHRTNPVTFTLQRNLEDSRGLGLEGKGKEEEGKGKERERKAADAAALAAELKEWLVWWNTLKAESAVPAGVSVNEPSQGILKAWQKIQKQPQLQKLLADRDAIGQEIRASEFCRESWFRLEKLFGGTNRDGELIIQKLIDGGYRNSERSKTRNGKDYS